MKFFGARNAAIKKSNNTPKLELIKSNSIHVKEQLTNDNFDEKNIFNTKPINLIDYSYKPMETLILRRLPYLFWVLGVIFILFGILIIVNIVIGKGKSNTIFNGFNDG